MWCPKCYGGMKEKNGICLHCGFQMKDLEGATNDNVKVARKNGKKEDILYTTKLPVDVKKKSLLLYCIFLGIFGAHNYYVGKFIKAIYMTTTFVFMTLFMILKNSGVGIDFVNYFYTFVALLQGVTIIMWIWDLISICFNKFKVPVYKEEFSKKD